MTGRSQEKAMIRRFIPESDDWDKDSSRSPGCPKERMPWPSPPSSLFSPAQYWRLPQDRAFLLSVWATAGEMSCVASLFQASVSHWKSALFLFEFKISKQRNKTEVLWCRASSIAQFCLSRKKINQTRSLLSPPFLVNFAGWICSVVFWIPRA